MSPRFSRKPGPGQMELEIFMPAVDQPACEAPSTELIPMADTTPELTPDTVPELVDVPMVLKCLGSLASANQARGYISAVQQGSPRAMQHAQADSATALARARKRANGHERKARALFFRSINQEAPTPPFEDEEALALQGLWVKFRKEFGRSGLAGENARAMLRKKLLGEADETE